MVRASARKLAIPGPRSQTYQPVIGVDTTIAGPAPAPSRLFEHQGHRHRQQNAKSWHLNAPVIGE
jgi:hypothetical protein